MKKIIKMLGKCFILYLLGVVEYSLLFLIAFEDDTILFFVTLVFFLFYCIGAILLLAKKGGKLKHICLGLGIIGFFISYVCYCELYPTTEKEFYEELCGDTGICSENVISKEECAKHEGTWKKDEDKWFCHLKWADVEE